MPKTMCPLCGAKTHINTGDPAALEAKYPEIWVVGFICRPCRDCDGPLAPGDQVVIRSGHNLGQSGKIDRVADCDQMNDVNTKQVLTTLPQQRVIHTRSLAIR